MSVKNILMAAGSSPTILQYVGGTSATFTTSSSTVSLTSLTGGISTSPSQGDVVIVFLALADTTVRTISVTGYRNLSTIGADDTYDVSMNVASKFMGVTPDTSLTVVSAASGASTAVVVQVWRGVDGTVVDNPFDFITSGTAANGAVVNPLPVTPTAPGSIVLVGAAAAHNLGIQTYNSPDLSNFISVGANATEDVTIGAGSYQWESGTFDPLPFTFSGTDSTSFSRATFSLVLTPSRVPTFIGSTIVTRQFDTTSGGGEYPAGTQVGDLIVCVVTKQGSNTTSGTGWTKVADGTYQDTFIRTSTSNYASNTAFSLTSSSSSRTVTVTYAVRNGQYVSAAVNAAAGTSVSADAGPVSGRFLLLGAGAEVYDVTDGSLFSLSSNDNVQSQIVLHDTTALDATTPEGQWGRSYSTGNAIVLSSWGGDTSILTTTAIAISYKG